MLRKLRNTAFMWHNLIVGRLTIRKTCVLRIVPSKEPLHVLRVRLEELLHYNREFQARSSESNMIVNGPSLFSEIFMSAPKIPV